MFGKKKVKFEKISNKVIIKDNLFYRITETDNNGTIFPRFEQVFPYKSNFYSSNELTKLTDYPASSIRRILQTNTVEELLERSKNSTKNQKKLIEVYPETFMSIKEISSATGYSASSIRNRLKQGLLGDELMAKKNE